MVETRNREAKMAFWGSKGKNKRGRRKVRGDKKKLSPFSFVTLHCPSRLPFFLSHPLTPIHPPYFPSSYSS